MSKRIPKAKPPREPVNPALVRPMPPQGIGEFDHETGRINAAYVPAPEVAAWVNAAILDESAPIHNPDHAHLDGALIRYLWAGETYNRKGRHVLGQAEEVLIRASKWQKGRQEQQMVEWFGFVPDFLITLDAEYCATCTDAEFCALVEHELYHIAQERDDYGQLAFTKGGNPKLELRGHDVEEFIGVVRRYGTGGPESDVARMVKAANNAPEVARLSIARGCGTCLALAA